MSLQFPEWQQLLQPLQNSLFPQSTPRCSSAANTINLLTCGVAGLLPPTTTSTQTNSITNHRLPAIADEILTAMLASGPSARQHQQQMHGSASVSESVPTLIKQKRSLYAAFPELSNDSVDEDASADDNISQQDEKKSRRLTSEQVRALEKAFEADNKLEPERKLQLATELGLQSRQVAIWFQNRRARSKTKQMEKDYGTLKEKFEFMKAQRDALLKEKEKLEAEVAQLKENLQKDGLVSNLGASQASPSPHPPSCFEPCAVKDSITMSPASYEQKENDGSTISDDSDGSDIVEVVESPQQVKSNVYLISKNFADYQEMLANSASLLDIPEAFYGRGNFETEIFTQKLTVTSDEGGLCDDANGGWSFPFEWWESN